MNYTDSFLGATVTQEGPVFPFMQFIAPTDYDIAAKQLKKIIELQYPGGILNPSNWRYVGMGESEIKAFLDRYIMVARLEKDFISVNTFGKFKSLILGKYPETIEDGLNVWLNAMIEAVDAGNFPESILKPYDYVPVETGVVGQIVKGFVSATNPLTNKILTYAVVGLVAYGVLLAVAPQVINKITGAVSKGTRYAKTKFSRSSA